MAKLILTDHASGFALISDLNANNALIETAIENTLSRDGTSPNTMSVALDMNSFNINNMKDAVNLQSAVTLAQLNAVVLASGNIVGATTDAVVRFDGTSFVEETQVQINSSGVLRIFDAGLTDNVRFDHDGTDFNITGTNTTELNITGITALNIPAANLNIVNITASSLIASGNIEVNNAAGGVLVNEGASSNNPTLIPLKTDLTSGMGSNGTGTPTIIAGGQEAVRYSEGSFGVLVAPSASLGLTADVGSSQGDGVIISSYNIYSTVANTGDAATLPASFRSNTLVHIKNDGANSMDVFPASGDDAGAGSNTAIAVAAGTSAVFIATVTNQTWTKLI